MQWSKGAFGITKVNKAGVVPCSQNTDKCATVFRAASREELSELDQARMAYESMFAGASDSEIDAPIGGGLEGLPPLSDDDGDFYGGSTEAMGPALEGLPPP